uniref:Olfactory receptor 133 n=1 Tax=Aulacocentrum confusum TaxID=2767324 RepID=A0A7G8Z9F2_9HYME|nr:olfactory receptor 133 [Aulacocentrum confusum]
MLLALFGSVALTFCVLGFQLIEVCTDENLDIPLARVLFYIQFLSYFFFLMLVYSWVGEYLVTQSMGIHLAICNCNWEKLQAREAAQLTIILLRSQHPLQITVGKLAPVNLSTYASLLKTSAGYVSFLLAVK